MTLVVNSGPLISLARIGQLGLLPGLFGEVVVPKAVFEETTRHLNRPGAEAIVAAGWLVIGEVSDRDAVERLTVTLDRGESEALVLAQEMKATVAMDERRGRGFAAALGVPQTGTVGILLTAKKHELIPAVTPLLDQLVANGIHLSARLYQEVRSLAGELVIVPE